MMQKIFSTFRSFVKCFSRVLSSIRETRNNKVIIHCNIGKYSRIKGINGNRETFAYLQQAVNTKTCLLPSGKYLRHPLFLSLPVCLIYCRFEIFLSPPKFLKFFKKFSLSNPIHYFTLTTRYKRLYICRVHSYTVESTLHIHIHIYIVKGEEKSCPRIEKRET